MNRLEKKVGGWKRNKMRESKDGSSYFLTFLQAFCAIFPFLLGKPLPDATNESQMWNLLGSQLTRFFLKSIPKT